MDALERSGVQPVHPLPPFVADVHEVHLAQHPQVLGHLRLGEPELGALLICEADIDIASASDGSSSVVSTRPTLMPWTSISSGCPR